LAKLVCATNQVFSIYYQLTVTIYSLVVFVPLLATILYAVGKAIFTGYSISAVAAVADAVVDGIETSPNKEVFKEMSVIKVAEELTTAPTNLPS